MVPAPHVISTGTDGLACRCAPHNLAEHRAQMRKGLAVFVAVAMAAGIVVL
jgi:hypothetical protein